MNVDPKLLQLPDFNLLAFIFVVLILFVWLFIYLILRYRQSRLDAQTIAWLNLAAYAQKREIVGKELRPLKSFFLTLTDKQREEIPGNKKLFRDLFLPFIENYSGISEVEKVKYIEKLVPEVPTPISIEVPQDLYLGESVALEFAGENYLGFVVKVKDNYGLFSLPKYHPSPKHLGLPVVVHAYRQGHGTYALDGVIQKTFADGFAVIFSGKVLQTGNEHLMALLEWQLKFTPWPEKQTTLAENPPEQTASAVDSEKKEAADEIPHEILGVSEKVSDRAMLVRFTQEFSPKALHKQEIWQMVANLPSGEDLKIRVKIFPSPQQKGKFIIRYIDIDEGTRIKLWEIIKANKPIRELIN